MSRCVLEGEGLDEGSERLVVHVGEDVGKVKFVTEADGSLRSGCTECCGVW